MWRTGLTGLVVLLAASLLGGPVAAQTWQVSDNQPDPFCNNPESPLHAETGFIIWGMEEAHITLQIWDPNMMYIVGSSYPEVLPPGMYEMYWNGTDGSGVPVPNGSYPYRLRQIRVGGGTPMYTDWQTAHVHCDTPVRERSWGAIKALYR